MLIHGSFSAIAASSTSLFRALLIATLCPIPSAFADDQPPAPTSFRAANAYSGTAGGVAWFRSTDDRGVAGYEITRDGAILGVFDALSYIDSNLEPGLEYQYGVRAVDTAGQRSSATFASLRTPGNRYSPGNEPPPPPANVRSVAYSSTAGAISWTRESIPGYTYRIERRGGSTALGAISNGTSFVDDSLEPGIDYLYLIRAIAPDGRRSSSARVTLSTPGRRPPAPIGLRLQRYSDTAAELFWDRTDVSSRVRLAEIRRNDLIIGTTDGTSFTDTSRASGETYRYDVIAIDSAGVRSEPSSVQDDDATTDDGEPNPPAGDFVIEQLETLFAIANGKALELAITIPERLRESPDVTLQRSYLEPGNEDGDPDREIEEFFCGNGGVVRSITYSVSGERPLTDHEINNCAFDSVIVSGNYTDLGGRYRVPANLPDPLARADSSGDYRIDGFQLTDERDGSTISLDGFHDRSYDVTDDTSYRVSWGASRMVVDMPGAAYEVSDLLVEDGYSPDRTFSPSTFSVARNIEFGVSLSDGSNATVSTTQAFYQGLHLTATPYNGILFVAWDPDLSYTLAAVSGDSETFQLDVSSSRGSSRQTIPWSDALSFNPFSTRDVYFLDE